MFKRIQQFFESIAYAGLKPSGGKPLTEAGTKKSAWLAQVQGRVDRFLNRGGPSDPLYLSNRTFLQKAGVWLILGLPSVIFLGGLGLVLSGYFDAKHPLPALLATPTNAEIAKKMLPDLSRNLHIETQHEVDIQDVYFMREGSLKLAGKALNKTDHIIRKVEIVFVLTDKFGASQGAVRTQLVNLAARSVVPFQIPIAQQATSFALVREVHVE